jgi:crotonobetaine/carnitine-CoA ligase
MSNTPTTLAGLLTYQARELNDKTFLLFEDQKVTFHALNANTNRVANALAKLGVQAGRGVSIMMTNAPEWLYTHFGVQKLNAYSVPINTGLKGEGLKHIINHSDSTLLVIDDTFIDTISDIKSELQNLEGIIVNETEGIKVPEGWLTLAGIMGEQSDEDPEVEIRDGEINMLQYTSGTTGLPKGVVTRYSSQPYLGAGFTGFLQPEDVMYTCLPLFHANALGITTMSALTGGNTLALSKRFSASRIWDEVRRYNASTFNALGAMIPILMKQPEKDNDADNPVKVILSAACPASVWEAFEKRFGVMLFEGYGAVDGGGFGVMNAGNAPKGSIGKPTSPYRLVDDDGEDVPVGESGELIFEVDDMKLRKVEYYKNEEASSAKIVDGWLHTGDMLHADDEGNLYFDDRKTDSLRRRGENISAWEVEREINKHEAVFESAVIGVKSDLGEDDVMAFVVLQPGASLTAEELIAHCQPLMAKFMIPRFIEFRSEFPKTGTHRIQKSVLKKEGVGPATWDQEKH